MVKLGEHETETRLADAAGDEFRTDIELHAERRERIRRTGFGAQSPVAVLGDRQAGAGDDDRGERRDIIGADAVTAGADDIDGIGGAETGSMRERMEETAPTISSTVSPRTRSAIRKPPICDGVASPDIRMSKAARDSSRFRLSPLATLAISGFSSAILSPPR